MIPKETIDRIFAAAKIEEVVADYISLKRRGSNWIGLCPFHNEKTGSFTVSPSKGIYKCFGCGASGNAVGFVMAIDQCSYVEALKHLAGKYHIEIEEKALTPEEQQRQDDRESMFVVNDWANKWFQEQLWETEEGQTIGLSYFRERGLREDTIRKFQLGYSPEKGNQLLAAARKKGYETKYLGNNLDTKIGTGVCGQNDKGDLYDRFRDRVIFPIHTPSGKTVAFAGRILRKKYDKDGNELSVGKYVNSPDSIIYSKTNELYGLYFAKQAIAKADLCYMVEGQMDVLSMYQAGIQNVVCSGGTALTQPQVRLIKRFTSNITVLYDGDAAGIHAALRGINMFLEEGFNVKVVLLPDGEDPDSFARKLNASDFIEYINQNQTDFITFKAKLAWEEAKNDPGRRSALVRDIVETIAVIPDGITRQIYTKDCADLMHVTESLLTREINSIRYHKKDEIIKAKREKEREEKYAASMATTPSTPAQSPAPAPSQPSAPKPQVILSKVDQNIRNLIQLIVRYGERALYPLEDGSFINVGDYIIGQMDGDCITPQQPMDALIIDEFRKHSHDDGFVAENFFKYHTNPEIASFACDLIVDKYQLSNIYSRQRISDNVTQVVKVKTDEDMLPELVPQLLYELKLTIVDQRIDAMQQLLVKAEREHDEQLITTITLQQPQLLAIRRQYCQLLGIQG